jgi:hypothetical protein
MNRPRPESRIEVLIGSTWEKATVLDILSTQFVAELEGGKVVFKFYADKGTEWREL